MNRSMKKFLTGTALVAVMALGASFTALAGRIAFSDPSSTTGETVNINMKITSTGEETIGRADVTLSYDSSMLEFVSGDGASGGAGTLKVTGSSNSTDSKELAFVLTFRALRPGNTTITIASQEVYDSDSQVVTIEQEGSSAITIAAVEGDSSNADLAGLQVSPGTLSPAFSKDVLEYTVTVDSDVETLVVDAPALDSGASVSVSGNESLQAGENTVSCTVTAQDGQTVKTYTITVTKAEGSESSPETGSGSVASDGVVLSTPERRVTVYPVTEDVQVPDGFVPAQVTIDGYDVQGWIWSGDQEEPDYCIFYATNENGDTDFYRYDLTEKTLQRYFRDPLADASGNEEYAALVENYNSLLDDYNMRFYVIIGLIALAVILLIVIIVLVATRGRKDDFYEKQRQDGGSYPERHNSGKQGRSQAGQTDTRRMSRDERYMRGLEEEEAAAERGDTYRAEQQIRDRQAQRRQGQSSAEQGGGHGSGSYSQGQSSAGQGGSQRSGSYPQGQSSVGQGGSQRGGGYPQGQGSAGQSGGQRSGGYSQGQNFAGQGGSLRSSGYPQEQRPMGQAGTQGQMRTVQGQQPVRQRPADQASRQAVPEQQNYVLRGPVVSEGEPADPRAADSGRRRPQGGVNDDDIQIIDID